MPGDGNFVDGFGDEAAVAVFIMTVVFCVLLLCCLRRLCVRRISDHPRERRVQDDVGNLPPIEDMQAMARRRYDVDRCPICFNGLVLTLETCCGHVFCGSCLRQYFTIGSYQLRALSCPICREEVNRVFICFSDEEEASNDENFAEERESIREVALRYNRNYSGEPRTISEYLWNLPILLNHLRQEFSALSVLSRVRIILFLVLAIIYLILPVDILPEAVFGVLGLLDDFLVLCFIIFLGFNSYTIVTNSILNGLDIFIF